MQKILEKKKSNGNNNNKMLVKAYTESPGSQCDYNGLETVKWKRRMCFQPSASPVILF